MFEAGVILKTKVDKEGSIFYSSARLWDDGVILPEDSRKVLGLAVATSMINHDNKPPKFGVFRM